MRTPHYSVKRTDFAVPLVPGLYKIHSIMWMLASLSHKIVRHRWPSGHYTNTGNHSSSLWLSFLAIVQQGRALERCFCGAQWHEYALPHLLEIYRKTPKSGHLFTQDTLNGTNGVRGSTVFNFENSYCSCYYVNIHKGTGCKDVLIHYVTA